jgi:hypothetical protein
MSDILDRMPTASLVVAVGLLVAAIAARALLYADDARLRDTARLYLEPLCVWCLIAVVVHGLALATTGTASILSIAVIFVIAAAAVALQAGDEAEAAAEPEPASAPEASAPAAPTGAPAPSAPSLWDDSRRPGGLWSR